MLMSHPLEVGGNSYALPEPRMRFTCSKVSLYRSYLNSVHCCNHNIQHINRSRVEPIAQMNHKIIKHKSTRTSTLQYQERSHIEPLWGEYHMLI